MSEPRKTPNAEAQEPASVPEPARTSKTPTSERRPSSASATPIRQTQGSEQPRLFETRGNGTYGPRPVFGQPAPGRGQRPEPIPANVAMREILQFIADDPNTKNWSGDVRQDLASTVMIGAYKAGLIGLWERGK